MVKFQLYTSNSLSVLSASALAYGACGHYYTSAVFVLLSIIVFVLIKLHPHEDD